MTKNGRESVKFNSERLLWSDNVVAAIPYLSHSKPETALKGMLAHYNVGTLLIHHSLKYLANLPHCVFF